MTESQVGNFARDGFLAPIPVMSPDDAASYRRRFEVYERENDGWYELSKGQKLYLLQTWCAELASHPRVLDAVADVLGPDILVWGTSLFVKDVGDRGFVSWHQDATYWGLSRPDVVTAWIALSPATIESGCMKMIPGSHRWTQLPHTDTLHDDNLLTRGQEIAVEVNEDEAVHLALRPGEISLHNIKTAHASEPNRSADRRVGVAVRYVAPHVSQTAAAEDSGWLVRGSDRFGHFLHETPPKADMDADALAEHARIMQIRQAVLYRGVRGRPAHTDL